MNKEELLSLAREAVHRFWQDNPDLFAKADEAAQPVSLEHGTWGESGYYQMEIEAMYDDPNKRAVRVVAFIEDACGLKGHYAIIVDGQGGVVSEGGGVKKKSWLF
ncbi:MAG: hypothetical protein Q4D91_09395 [Lautropia sp.]|nr:hypothetical protein [Lautropia sp.]